MWLGGAALAAAGLVLTLALRRRQTPEEKERERRLHLSDRGRLAEGSVMQLTAEKGRRLLCYQYSVAQVTYNAVQDITSLLQLVNLDSLCEGLPTRVKYDPQNPGDSIVVGETWNGLS